MTVPFFEALGLHAAMGVQLLLPLAHCFQALLVLPGIEMGRQPRPEHALPELRGEVRAFLDAR